MKITKVQLISFVVVFSMFIVLGLTVRFPLLEESSKKQTLFQSANALEIISMSLFVVALCFVVIYFVPVKDIALQIKSFRKPIMKLQKEKFEYWLKSELYEHEIKHAAHREIIDNYEVEKALKEIDVLKKAAELNDMETQTYIKLLTAQANANYTQATSEKEKAEAKVLMEAVPLMSKMPPMWQAYIISCVTKVQNTITEDLELKREFNEIVKDKQKEDLRKAVIENDNLQEKYKRNKVKAE